MNRPCQIGDIFGAKDCCMKVQYFSNLFSLIKLIQYSGITCKGDGHGHNLSTVHQSKSTNKLNNSPALGLPFIWALIPLSVG